MNGNGNGWKSRKTITTLLIIIAGIVLTGWLVAVGRYDLAVAAFGITAGVVGVYNGANAWQSRAYSDHGQPPGTEP